MISGPSPIIPGFGGFKKLRKSLILCGMGMHICSAGFAGFVRLNWFAFVAWSLVRHPQCPNDDQIYLASAKCHKYSKYSHKFVLSIPNRFSQVGDLTSEMTVIEFEVKSIYNKNLPNIYIIHTYMG